MPRGKGNYPIKNRSGITTKQEVKKDTSIETIDHDKEQKEMLKKPYKCVTCGKRFTTQANNFSYSQSPLFNGNNHYLPTCSHCIDDLVEQYTKLLGNQNEAIKRVCLHYDIYVSDSLLSSCKKIDAGRSRMKNYIKQCNLFQNSGKTYSTYLSEISKGFVESQEQIDELKARGELSVTQAAYNRFGIGLGNDNDYKILDDHYKMLKKANPNCDSNQEIFIKSLCNLYLIQTRALKDNNTKGYIDANSEYTKTFKQAGLKIIQDEEKNMDDCWGIFMEQISKYTPEEYYKDKKLYEDYDKIGNMFERFVLRPLKNLLCKENVRDSEYNIEDVKDE